MPTEPEECERLLAFDFGGPALPAQQRRKIVGLEALRLSPGRYSVGLHGLNRGVVERGQQGKAPGFSVYELMRLLLEPPRPSRVGFDFSFSIPKALLHDEALRLGAEQPPGDWRAFQAQVARLLPLPTDGRASLSYACFDALRYTAQGSRLWQKRLTDQVAHAQPALKDVNPCLLPMTLLGASLLHFLRTQGGYRLSGLEVGLEVGLEAGLEKDHGSASAGKAEQSHDVTSEHTGSAEARALTDGSGLLLEVYPGAALRTWGLRNYKQQPEEASRRLQCHLEQQGIALEVAPEVLQLCHRYSSGARQQRDPDLSDALVALGLVILHREGRARPLVPTAEPNGTGGWTVSPEVAAQVRAEGVIWGVGSPE